MFVPQRSQYYFFHPITSPPNRHCTHHRKRKMKVHFSILNLPSITFFCSSFNPMSMKAFLTEIKIKWKGKSNEVVCTKCKCEDECIRLIERLNKFAVDFVAISIERFHQFLHTNLYHFPAPFLCATDDWH